MLGSTTQFVGRRKKFGPVMLVTEDFRRDLRAWLKLPGNNQRQLALAIGCDPSAISQLLNKPEDFKTSELVTPIAAHAGISIGEDAEAMRKLGRLRDKKRKDYDAIVALINTLSED